MRHLKSGRKLKRTSSHRKALLRNLATALFQYKKLSTTEAKAKELRPFAERLITKAKHALLRERQKDTLPEGQTIDIHNRRIVGRYIRNKAVLQELFDAIAPAVENRQGGYTRIIKTGTRRGDAARTATIELVDWSAPQDGASSLKRKRPKVRKPAGAPAVKPQAAPKAVVVENAIAEAEVVETVETAEVETVVDVQDTPAEETVIVAEVEETPAAAPESAEPVAEQAEALAPADEKPAEDTSSEPASTEEEKKD